MMRNLLFRFLQSKFWNKDVKEHVSRDAVNVKNKKGIERSKVESHLKNDFNFILSR